MVEHVRNVGKVDAVLADIALVFLRPIQRTWDELYLQLYIQYPSFPSRLERCSVLLNGAGEIRERFRNGLPPPKKSSIGRKP